MSKRTKKNSGEYPKRVTGGALARLSFWKRLKRWLGDNKWLPLVLAMWVLTIVLGCIGWSKYPSAVGEPRSAWDIFYRTLQLFVLESSFESGPLSWQLDTARFMAPATAAYTAIQALTIVFYDRLQLLLVRFLRDHVVICGLGRKGFLLTEGYRKKGERVVVVEQDKDNSMIGRCKDLGVTVLVGNATDPGLLRRARVYKAKYLISVCGDDGANAEVAVHAREIARRRKGWVLTCLVHIYDLQLCNLLREQEMEMGKQNTFRLEFFNVFESGARIMLQEYPPFSETSEGHGSRSHIVVVGVGRIGESLVVNAARSWWDRDNISGERLRVTLVDKEAERKRESLCFRYPQLAKVCDLVPVQVDVRSPEFERAEFLFDRNGRFDITMVYVCLDDDANALGAALLLHHRMKSFEIPIVVRTAYDAGLATLLRSEKDKHKSFTSVHAFGLLDHTCTPDLIFGSTYEILARAIHEDYVRNEREKGNTPQTNPSMVPWEELPESLKESNRGQAGHIPIKLEAIGYDMAIATDWDTPTLEFSPEEVEFLAEMEHERWVEERLRGGWKPGPVKNIEKKISDLLVPWNDLPEEEKDKDRIPVKGIPAFLAKARFQVYRLMKREWQDL